MQKSLKVYNILSYILLPIAVLFAIIDIAMLLSALSNPGALIMVFVVACLVIYTFASFKFFRKGILQEQTQSVKLKDWIKVNAYVSFFLCGLFFINSVSIIVADNATLNKIIDEFLTQQPGIPAQITHAMVLSILRGVSVFLLISGSIGLIHIRTTLRLVREYDYLFE
jgi:uncharacterized membrane protein